MGVNKKSTAVKRNTRTGSKNDPLLPKRLAGNVLLFAAHSINIIIMHLALQSDIMKDKDLAIFHTLQWKYITIWNLAFQNLYLLVYIICDLCAIFKLFEKNKLLEEIRRFRITYFSAILWPTTLTIFLIFWPIFTINRELVFPSYIDKVLSYASNHMLHSFIVVVNVWELVWLPRSKPESHKNNLMYMAIIFVTYLFTVLGNYFITGLWPYPMLYDMYGTIYFPLLVIGFGILYLLSYYVQWPLVKMLHGSKKTV